jgi:hypothetical protein
MMTRTQLSLDSEMLRRARKRAAELGISLAEYVRRLVAEDLGGRAQTVDPSVVFNLGSSGGSDIAANKDAMIADAIGKGLR